MIDLITEYEKHLREQVQAGSLAESTAELYVYLLRRMDRELEAGLLSAYREELHAWIFTPRRKTATRQLYVTIVKGFTKFATGSELEFRLDHDEAAGLPNLSVPKTRPKPIPAEHLADIRARAHEPWGLLFDLAHLAGLRCCEIAGLDRADITEDEVRVVGKGSKPRDIPTHPELWRRVRDLGPGPIAFDEYGDLMDRRRLSRWGWRRLHTLGYPYSMHQLRHSFATEVYETSGRDIMLVKELLGHASVATTQVYIGVNRDRKAAAVHGLTVPGVS